MVSMAFGALDSRPNVIFVLTDDLGYLDLSCYGATKLKTPNIDRLAAEGLRFTDFHTAASICSPSRAAFLCGAYPQRTGLYMGINQDRRAHWFLGLNPGEITIAEQFKKRGDNTGMVGKWHLGTEPEFSMLQQGFDEYAGVPDNYVRSQSFLVDEKVVIKTTPLDQLTELYTERVVDFIKRQGDQAFFLYYAHNYPHSPFKAGEKFQGSSLGGPRGDVMQELDWGIGEMIKALEQTGVADNTLIIFASDNGATVKDHARPYRGTKFVSLEGGHRVPFILHWPERIKKSSVLNVPINAMDLFPTLSEIIGAPMPKDRVYDGVSLVPLFDGQPLARKSNEPFFYYNCENLQAVRLDDWKLHLPRKKEQLPFWDRNKAFWNLSQPVLYNLYDDAGEKTDVAMQHPELVQKMVKLAEEMRSELGEYLQRGKGQRPTGSAIPGAPIVSHEKDWEKLIDSALSEAILQEHLKRHPNSGKNRKVMKKKRKK